MNEMNEDDLKYFSLVVNNLTVSYGKTVALWDINLAIPEAKIVGIIGPNGAGKSTFLKAVIDLITPLSGKIQFLGQSFKEAYRKIAYVPQRESVDWDFPVTVEQLVTMGRYGKLGLFNRPKKADFAASEHYLKLVGIESFAKRQISQLSGGQQQRAFLARALVQDADIYFLDEPFSGIDIASEKIIMGLLHDLRDRGKTVFIVHHDLNTVKSYFDWLILLNVRLIASGPTDVTFTTEKLYQAYGKSYSLFEEANKLSESKLEGFK